MADIDLGIPGLSNFEEIGAGGFASVFSAYESEANRRVAVKVLSAIDERGRRRFDRERRTMGQTTGHDNIVTMFRSGYTEPNNHPFLIMEHMSGGSLQDRLEAVGPYSLEDAIRLILPVVDGLGFAHAAGIIHKDVKPANILISATGSPKLSDFGIAAIRDSTSTSQVAFSLFYAPPETFSATRGPDGEHIDPRDERSDLYSLAASLYALVTGVPPFAAESQAGLMGQILTEEIPPIGLPDLDEFFATALAKNPAERFPNAVQFSDALRTVYQHHNHHPAGPVTPSTGQPAVAVSADRSTATRFVGPPGASQVDNNPGHANEESGLVRIDSGQVDGSIEYAGGGNRRWWIPATVAAVSLAAIGTVTAITIRDADPAEIDSSLSSGSEPPAAPSTISTTSSTANPTTVRPTSSPVEPTATTVTLGPLSLPLTAEDAQLPADLEPVEVLSQADAGFCNITTETPGLVEELSVLHNHWDGNDSLFQFAARFDSESSAAAYVIANAETLVCSSWNGVTVEGTQTYTASAIALKPLVDLGDETQAWETAIIFTETGFEITRRAYMMRRFDRVVYVSFATDERQKLDQVPDLIELMVDRLGYN